MYRKVIVSKSSSAKAEESTVDSTVDSTEGSTESNTVDNTVSSTGGIGHERVSLPNDDMVPT